MKHYFFAKKAPILALLVIFLGLNTFAGTRIHLRFTYHGNGVANHQITVKGNDRLLGKGVTDANGDVYIDGPVYIPPKVDVYGHVDLENGEGNWELLGWVRFDSRFSAHVKMEEVIKSFADQGLTEEMVAVAWGLTASSGQAPATTQPTQPTPAVTIAPAEPEIPTGYKCRPIGQESLQEYLTQMEKASFASEKTTIAQQAIKGNCVGADQVKELVSKLSMGQDKLDLAKWAYAYVANPSGYSVVEEALSTGIDRQELRDFIAKKEKGESQPATTSQPTQPANNHAQPPALPAKGAQFTLNVFSEDGQAFYLTVDGVRQNETPQTRVSAKWSNSTGVRPNALIEFADTNIPPISQKLMVGSMSDTFNYKLKKDKKGVYSLKVQAY